MSNLKRSEGVTISMVVLGLVIFIVAILLAFVVEL